MDRVHAEPLDTLTATPARLTVYDAPLDLDSITTQMRENLDDELTEVKGEIAIDRITAQANPRTLERVPAGARFRVRIVLDLLCEQDKELVPLVGEALLLLEDDSLGGGGSRGSGRVRFQGWKAAWRGRAFYSEGAPEQELLSAADTAALRTALRGSDLAAKLS
jgi:CRISPR-associated protein Csm3